MDSIKKILVPTDFSSNAVSAYKHSREIADRFNAKVDFIHIVPTLRYFSASMANLGAPLDMESDLYPKVQKEATRQLEDLMDQHLTEEQLGEAICKVGRKPAERIAGWAQENEYDLIVLSSKGEHETHLLRGSITSKLIRKSEVPVFSVGTTLSTQGLKRILLPTDGSTLSFSALPLTLLLAEIYEADIILYHAIELYGDAMDRDRAFSESDNTLQETLLHRLQNYLNDEHKGFIELREEGDGGQFIISGDEEEFSITFSVAAEKSVSAHIGIENYSQNNADLVVMATHGRSGWEHLLLGSTAEKVARHLDIPVATVRPHTSKLNKKQSQA